MSLKKNIRKILKENMDDLQWIRDIEVDPLKSGTLMFISPLNTNAVKWPHKNNNIEEYIVLRITNVTDGRVYYESIVDTSDNYYDGDIPLEDANKLINTGYWRVLSVNTPQEYITPGIKNYYNDKVESKDFLPYIIFDGEKMKLNQLKESDDLQWIRDIKSYPTLQQLFDAGEINEGDLLVLRGEVENGFTNETTWVGEFTVTIDTKKELLELTTFILDPNEHNVKKVMGITSMNGLLFLISDGNLEVIKKNNQSTQLTEQINESDDDLKWIKDIDTRCYVPRVGERIRVHNIGDERAFIEWLGQFAEYYEYGDFGEHIEGVVEEVVGDIGLRGSTIWLRVDTKYHKVMIVFPIFNEEKVKDLKIYEPNTRYYGLSIFYEPI
jgi:hypothetical protein